MYGMINKAIKEMSIKDFGQDTWDKILQQSGVPEDSFLTMRDCDDNITYRLVVAASSVLELPAETVLEAFGVHWIKFSAAENYNDVLNSTGNNVIGFLDNVNSLHDRIMSTFVDFRPPSFELEVLDHNEAKLHYKSERAGLSSFMVGILHGLGERFDSKVNIIDTEYVNSVPGEHTIFHIVCEQST